jgi:hypothetical protein
MKDKSVQKDLDNAKGHFEIDVNGLEPIIKAEFNGGAALLIAAHSMILTMAKSAKIKPQEALMAVISFMSDTSSLVADSREQMDVMNEILNRGGKIDDLM